MAVTGADRWYVSIVVLGKGHHVFCIERDEDAIQTLIEAEREFWEEHVVPRVPPLPTGSEADGEALNALYPAAEVEDAAMDLGGLDDLLNLRGMKVEQRDALQAEIDDIDQQIKAEMGTFERGVSGHWTVRWSNTESRRVDTKALKAKYPKIAEECVKVTKGRRFTVNRIDEKEDQQ
jgi:predicted phage-related endonuclease